MMYPKPKSAPGRIVNSKFVKNRTNAMKEIEAWVKKDDDRGSSHEASRMSGQLTDNVTEERMLRAKLWELSKERYKFLAQNAYEKKMFTDRMQRKSSALLRRSNSSAASSKDGGAESPTMAGMSPAKRRWRNARLALLDRLDPTKQKDRANKSEADDKTDKKDKVNKSEDDKVEAKRRGSSGGGRRGPVTPAATPITVTPAGGMGAGGGKVILAPLPVAPLLSPGLKEEAVHAKPPPSPSHMSNARNVKFDKMANRDTEGGKGPSRQSPTIAGSRASPNATPGAVPPPGVIPTRPVSGSILSSKPNSATSLRSKPWTSTTATPISAGSVVGAFGGHQMSLATHYGMRLQSKTDDPRYAQLEDSLSPIQKQRNHSDVKAIVKSFDALHVPPRRRKEAKPKTELKALEYMEEQGFVFFNNS